MIPGGVNDPYILRKSEDMAGNKAPLAWLETLELARAKHEKQLTGSLEII